MTFFAQGCSSGLSVMATGSTIFGRYLFVPSIGPGPVSPGTFWKPPPESTHILRFELKSGIPFAGCVAPGALAACTLTGADEAIMPATAIAAAERARRG